VTVCKGYWAKTDPESQWPQRRLFRWQSFDAIDFEDFAMQKAEQIKPMCSSWYRRAKKPAQFAYNTKDAVATLDHMDIAGLCLTCNGKRSQKKCSCPNDVVPPGLAISITHELEEGGALLLPLLEAETLEGVVSP
jgi:hypothetical protein